MGTFIAFTNIHLLILFVYLFFLIKSISLSFLSLETIDVMEFGLVSWLLNIVASLLVFVQLHLFFLFFKIIHRILIFLLFVP